VSSAIIDLSSLRVVKNGRSICEVPRLTVQPGERVAIIGANGSGKTTLLRVLAGLESDFQGQCELHAEPSQRTLVHQIPYLFRGSVLSNVSYGLRARGQSRSTAANAALECLQRFGIGHLASRRTRNLSGGERRRVALARAVVLDVRLLLLDEPLADLDDGGIESLCRALAALPDTTVVTTSPTKLRSELSGVELHLAEPRPAQAKDP